MFGLDTIKEAVGNPIDFIGKSWSSLKEAWNCAKDADDKGFFEKFGIFFSKFAEEFDKLGKEKEDITKEAQAAASKTAEQATADATATVKLDESKVEKADADLYKEALTSGVASMKSLSPEQQAFASKGLDKLKKAAKITDKAELEKLDHLNLDEFKAVAATGLSTLKALKTKFPDKKKLADALAQISKASDSSEYPIVGILKTAVLKVLKPDIGATDLLPFSDFSKMLGGFGIGLTDLPGLKSDMALLKEPDLTIENKTKVVTAYRKYIIPNTNESDATKVVDFVHDMVLKKPEQLTIDQLAEIVSLVDAKDLDQIIRIFTGKTEKAANVA